MNLLKDPVGFVVIKLFIDIGQLLERSAAFKIN